MNAITVNRRLIIERRDALCLSQRALAKALGVIPNVIYVLEDSDRSDVNLTPGFLSRLAEVLGVDATALLVSPSADGADAHATPPRPDAARLLAALMDKATVTLAHRDDLARAFDWPIERVAAAVSDAGDALPARAPLVARHEPPPRRHPRLRARAHSREGVGVRRPTR